MTDDDAVPAHAGYTEHSRSSDEKAGCGCSCKDCNTEPDDDRKPGPQEYYADDMRPDGSDIEGDAAPATTLATVMLTNGARIEFDAIEEAPGRYGIAMRELGDSQRMMPSALAGLAQNSARDIFATLCPKNPMPRAIAELAKGKADGKLVDVIDDPIEVDLDDLDLASPNPIASAASGGYGGHFCVPGQGWHDFKAFACNFSGPSNTWFWCDPGAAYYYRQRSTYGAYRRKRSFGITATCGSPAETRHYYYGTGKWRRVKTWYLPNNYWQWTRYDGLSNRNRRVKHVSSIQGGSSFLRSVTAIYT